MQSKHSSGAPTIVSSPTNGHSTVHDIFVLSDEQILEIDPEPQDVDVSATARSANGVESAASAQPEPGRTPPSADRSAASKNAAHQHDPSPTTSSSASTEHGARNTEPAAPPAWLAAQMKDAWNGAEARALWERVQAGESEAAAYREVFAKPEDARAIKALYPGGAAQAQATAERARLLDEIDRAYFAAQAGTPEQARASRAQLAAMMLREDPAAFREMVYEGLRAIETANGSSGRLRSIADVIRRDSGEASSAQPVAQAAVAQAFRPEAFPSQRQDSSAQNAPAAGHNALTPEGVSYSSDTHRDRAPYSDGKIAAQQAQLAAYTAFEKAANTELEKSVGGAIDRALYQALPNMAATDRASGSGTQDSSGTSLQARLSQAIREDVERALQGDRQLGEQVAQVLSSRRLDDTSRAQVVRLINERALQLVPVAAKRALNDWTQATLAAHRSRTARNESAASRREVAAAAPRDLRASETVAHPFRGEGVSRQEADRGARAGTRPAGNARINYGKLSDDQILDL